MYITHRHFILLSLALAAFIVSALGFSLLRQQILEKAASTSAIHQEIQLLDEKKQREQDIAALYAKTSEDLARLNSFVASRKKIVDVIEYIEEIGEVTSTKFELSAIGNEESEAEIAKKGSGPLSHLTAHIEAEGSWADVLRALILLEHMPYSATLGSIRLMESDGTGVWKLTLDIRILTSL